MNSLFRRPLGPSLRTFGVSSGYPKVKVFQVLLFLFTQCTVFLSALKAQRQDNVNILGIKAQKLIMIH